MTTPAYCTQAEFDEYVSDDFGAVESGLRLSALLAAEQRVNEHCQRTFSVAGGASARLYAPTGEAVLRIHDATTVTAITVNGAALTTAQYQLEPTTVALDGVTRPYDRIRLLSSLWYVYVEGQATISVTGTWGWTATPVAVKEAVKLIGRLNLLRRRMFIAESEYDAVLRNIQSLCRDEALGIA